jgi:hypothetical protein
MGFKKIVSIILRAPLHIFLIGSFVLSIYAVFNKTLGVGLGTPILFGVILACWYFGIWLSRGEEVTSDVMYGNSEGEVDGNWV